MMVGGVWIGATAQSLAGFQKNFFANSMAKWAQAGPGSNASSTCANATAQFTNMDMIYVNNILGTTGVVTTQQGGSIVGSENTAQAKITTAPTSGQANGCELYWFIDDNSTAEIVDQFGGGAQVLTVSFLIQALGNVTSIGIQPYYSNTVNTKPATSLVTEQTFTVNASNPTQCVATFVIPNGTLASGYTIAFRIRISAVSTGQTYDLNNGFQVGRAQCNYGLSAQLWAPFGGNWDEDLKKCYRLYQKSAELGTNPQSGVNTGQQDWPAMNSLDGATVSRVGFAFREVMMQTPVVSNWDYNGVSGNFWYLVKAGSVGGTFAVSAAAASSKSCYWNPTLPSTAYTIVTQWAADARPSS